VLLVVSEAQEPVSWRELEGQELEGRELEGVKVMPGTRLEVRRQSSASSEVQTLDEEPYLARGASQVRMSAVKTEKAKGMPGVPEAPPCGSLRVS
jgi:hypothetical protein